MSKLALGFIKLFVHVFRAATGTFEYELISCTLHVGPSLNNGHYKAIALEPWDKEYYQFNDDKVNKCTRKDVMASCKSSYTLFYTRITPDDDVSNLGPDSLHNLAAPTEAASLVEAMETVENEENMVADADSRSPLKRRAPVEVQRACHPWMEELDDAEDIARRVSLLVGNHGFEEKKIAEILTDADYKVSFRFEH